MSDTDPVKVRLAWLDRWLDLDESARAKALSDPTLPNEWRQSAERALASTRSGILDRGTDAVVAALVDTGDLHPAVGLKVGRYILTEQIGQGGMATVWAARHEDVALGQKVAVKFLHPLLSTPDWHGRFLREQRILARLVHPGITRLHDAGIDAGGTPYIVMEFVSGAPITRYADEMLLDVTARVTLFLKVVSAVAHAHHILVVHRDLKPGNILVDGDGEPHLLDFGIAKLLDASGAAEATRTGQSLLTPAYAAPEQWTESGVTTATDVYGLGAVLHELMTGARANHLADGRLELPSSRVDLAASRARGESNVRALQRQLRGDLDAILDRALRPEPARRYASAAALADDLTRWIDGAPVLARAGHWQYRAAKFGRRHWLALGLSAALVLGLGVATVVSWHASRRADAAAVLANAEAARARNSRDFVLELMQDLRPGQSSRSPERLLDRAAELVAGRFANDPEARIDLLMVLGELERTYGRLDISRERLVQAANLARGMDGPGSARLLDAEASLAHTLFRKGAYPEGAARLRDVLTLYDAVGGDAGPARIRALARLGQLEEHQDHLDIALRLLGEADAAADRRLAETDPLRLTVQELHGGALANAGRLNEARQILRENLVLIRARFGNKDLAVASALEALALRELEAGEPDSALPLLLDARRIADELLDGPHVIAGYVDNSLGLTELRLGHPDLAERHFTRALATFEALYDAPHRQLEATLANLGEAAFERGDYRLAAERFDLAAAQRDELQATAPLGGWPVVCLAAEAWLNTDDPWSADSAMQRCSALVPDAPVTNARLAGLRAARSMQRGSWTSVGTEGRAALNGTKDLAATWALQPVQVMVAFAVQGDEADKLPTLLEEALRHSEAPIWTRPCSTARNLRAIVGSVPSASLQVTTQLMDRANRFECNATEAVLRS